jgi:hypothetical protein
VYRQKPTGDGNHLLRHVQSIGHNERVLERQNDTFKTDANKDTNEARLHLDREDFQ